MAPFDALKMARERNLDLVEISPTAQPPVCRIMDYGKFLYQNEKREREAKKKQKTITVKEVKFRINVDDHDYDTKKNHVLRFLDEGDKVKATIFFRGREMTRQSLGRGILERLIKDVEHKGLVEFRPRQEGNTLHLILAPKKDAAARTQCPRHQNPRLLQHKVAPDNVNGIQRQNSANSKIWRDAIVKTGFLLSSEKTALRTGNRELGTDFNA
jgi:translation initiation factor IF-3